MGMHACCAMTLQGYLCLLQEGQDGRGGTLQVVEEQHNQGVGRYVALRRIVDVAGLGPALDEEAAATTT